MSLVSIIVPNYNHAPFLRHRLDSIFNQTFRNFEVIILDDCSTDNSKEIIEEYRSYPQVSHIVYNETNSGSPFKQWAKGFNLAQGDYIWIAESDDWAESNFLEETLPILKSKKNLSLVFSASRIVSIEPHRDIYLSANSMEMQGKKFIETHMILDNGIPNASAVLFRRDRLFLISDDYQNFRGAGDCVFWINLCEHGDVFFLAKPLNYFRIHQDNKTKKCRNDGSLCQEAYTIKSFLQQRGYISYWVNNLLILKNIERINELNRTKSFSNEVNVSALMKLWKQNNSFIFVKTKIIQLSALIQKISFMLGIIKEPQNLIFVYFKNKPLIALIWSIFNLPSFMLPYVLQADSYIKRPLNLFDNWAAWGRLNWMPSKLYLSLMFRSRMGYWMCWKHPKTFNEKLQWLKLYDRNTLYTQLVDKYEVRKYVAEKIGKEYLIPVFGVWDNVENIDFTKLPDSFVLKCTHDSDSIIICKKKKDCNLQDAKKKLAKALSKNFYFKAREWPYKNVKPQVIAEKYIENYGCDELYDYKFFCFAGIPKFMYISHDKSVNPSTDFFDMEFKRIDMKMKDPNSKTIPTKPAQFEKMIALATKLSQGIPHVRVDFYCVQNQIYFGEMTFFHSAGFFKITPQSKATEIGNLITLPISKRSS